MKRFAKWGNWPHVGECYRIRNRGAESWFSKDGWVWKNSLGDPVATDGAHIVLLPKAAGRGGEMTDNNDILYGDGEQERLCCDPEEIIEQMLDDRCQKTDESFDVLAARIGWPVRIYLYRRMKLKANRIVEDILKILDENYGDPDGGETKPTPEMMLSAERLAEVFNAEYKPWLCEQTGESEEFTLDMARATFKEDWDYAAGRGEGAK